MKHSKVFLTGHSIQGARHIQMNTPCQDAVFVHQEEDLFIMCAADGHGDSKHARSDEGAKIAVHIAGRILRQAFFDLKHDQRNYKELEQSIREHLPRRISWEWNRAVQQSTEGHWTKKVVLFGCTLLAAAISADLCIFVQLGDGDMLFLDQQGQPEFIFPPDDQLYGTVTRSLCQPNVALHTQVQVRTLANPRLFLMSTDGLRDSLQDNEENYIKVGKWLLQKYQNHGFHNLNKELPEWISKLSFQGNGDDTTMAFSIWPLNNEDLPSPAKNHRPTPQIKDDTYGLYHFFGEPIVESNRNHDHKIVHPISTRNRFSKAKRHRSKIRHRYNHHRTL